MKIKMNLLALLCFCTLLAGCRTSPEGMLSPADTEKPMTDSAETEKETEAETKEEAASFVLYSDFGAKGDGVQDDLAAIAAAHRYANEHGLPVRADEGAVYYIASTKITVPIGTDTDWRGASFIIDDTGVSTKGSQRAHHVFEIPPSAEAYSLKGITSVARGQTSFEVKPETDVLLVLTNDNHKQFIRVGKNANDGSSQSDIMILRKDGTVEPGTESIWDFAGITEAKAIPMDKETLTVTGGTFTTIANNQDSSSYYNRGIHILRSNVVLDGIVHYVKGEGEKSAPYYGFLNLDECANVTVKNCILTGRKQYSPGTYDIKMIRALNITFENCTQSNDIRDTAYWGIMLTHRSKNLTLRNCSFSRVDAHSGFYNVTIEGCTLGHQCINAIGGGKLRIENSTLYGKNLINLRSDYGSVWNGDVVIRNCTWIPHNGKSLSGSYYLIGGSNSRTHDFGYECCLPYTVTVENLRIDDSARTQGYAGAYLFANFCTNWTSEAYEKKIADAGFPYNPTQTVTLRGVTADSGMPLRLSPNMFMFRKTEVSGLAE